MVDTGLLTEDARVELIDGEIIEMPPIGSPHAGKVKRLNRLLSSVVGDKAIVSAQDPVVMGEHDEPQPDLAVLRWRDDFYEDAHPGPGDVLLIIEVSDTTVRFDRGVKVLLYARHGIPETWLVNLQQQCLEVYRDLRDGRYQRVEKYQSGSVSPECLSDIKVTLQDLFPK